MPIQVFKEKLKNLREKLINSKNIIINDQNVLLLKKANFCAVSGRSLCLNLLSAIHRFDNVLSYQCDTPPPPEAQGRRRRRSPPPPVSLRLFQTRSKMQCSNFFLNKNFFKCLIFGLLKLKIINGVVI